MSCYHAKVGAVELLLNHLIDDVKERQAVEFHLRNAAAWANDRTGCNLAEQVDPDFVHGPDALAQSGQLPATTR